MIKTMTGVLFILLLGLGLWIASQRTLWNDEYYSLFSSTLHISYKSMVMGDIGEGNNFPLFYILQKAQCDLFSYHPPQEWVEGHWGGVHVFDQFFLRIQSVVLMSMGLSTLFYYFCRRNSWLVGAYALAVAVTSTLFWFHWTEARPYAVWISLSLFQILLLLNILENPGGQNKKSWIYLFLVHWLMALTISLGIIQILAAGVALWMFHRPKLLWYIPLVLIPLGICGFYYLHAPHYPLFFVDGPVALISANIPKDRLFIIFMSAVVLFLQCRRKNTMARLEIKYLVFLLLLLGGFGLVLFTLKYGQAEGQHGFRISSRYFLPLLPMGTVGTVLFSVYLVSAFPSRVWRAAAIMILAGFLLFRAHKTIQHVPRNEILPSYGEAKIFNLMPV